MSAFSPIANLTRSAKHDLQEGAAAGEAPDLNWLRKTTLPKAINDSVIKLASDSKTN